MSAPKPAPSQPEKPAPHTPGPWRLCTTHIVLVVRPINEEAVSDGEEVMPRAEIESRINSQPDLLAALEQMTATFETRHPMLVTKGFAATLHEDQALAYTAARAAIQKARHTPQEDR